MATQVVVEEKTVYVVWANTDLTEGRGRQIPTAVCACEATARRLAKGCDVQGSNGSVTPEISVKLSGGGWLGPYHLINPTLADEKEEVRIKNVRDAEQRRREALARAEAAGLSKEDLEALK